MTAALLAQACTCARPPKESVDRPATPMTTTASVTPSVTAAAPVAARGMWVWRTKARLAEPGGTQTLLDSCQRAGLNEVYLSVNPDVMDDARLPALMVALRAANLRIEALMGDAVWYRPESRALMFASIEAVAAYNRKNPTASFAGIHLDVEPHQLPENKGNHRFVPVLAEALGEASALATKNDLTSSADLPRFALDENGPAFARAVGRPFVMLYELRDRSAEGLSKTSGSVVDHTYAGVGSAASRMVIGVSVDDYPGDLEAMLRELDGTKAGNHAARYGGWAIHDEARYRARRRP
jgi:hypothetical protein